jgi:hypothetical protein
MTNKSNIVDARLFWVACSERFQRHRFVRCPHAIKNKKRSTRERFLFFGGLGRNRKILSLPRHASFLFNIFILGTSLGTPEHIV